MNRNGKWKLCLLLLLWAMVFLPAADPMVKDWFRQSDNTHAFLVPFLSLYFAWRKREDLARVEMHGSLAGAAFLAAGLALYLLAQAGGIAVLARLMMVFTLAALLWTSLGGEATRLLSFPLGFLFFMVPVPDSVLMAVSFPLQLLTTKISTEVIQACSIPVYREGNILHFMQSRLEVVEACSGIRSVVALTMISVLFAHLSGGVRWRQFVLVVSAIPIAMLANVLRVSGTGILAHFYGGKVAGGFLHEFSGMVVFLIGLLLLFLVYAVLNRIGSRA